MFERGEKIKCINGDFSNLQHNVKMDIWLDHLSFPKTNKTYTVRNIIAFPEKNTNGLLLEEIKNPPCYPLRGLVVELNFDEKRFRKLSVLESIEEQEEEMETVL